jgi:hypothetical protein
LASAKAGLRQNHSLERFVLPTSSDLYCHFAIQLVEEGHQLGFGKLVISRIHQVGDFRQSNIQHVLQVFLFLEASAFEYVEDLMAQLSPLEQALGIL